MPLLFAVLLLFAITLFVSAFLLFLVQPLIAQMILPLLGGTPAVWNTCMVFFQAVLLVGYGYSHGVTTYVPVRRQTILQICFLILPLFLLPFSIGEWTPTPGVYPFFSVLYILLLVVGLPFLVVSTSAPLLQRWFSSTGHPSAKDPYFLYGASNLGSLAALWCYPFLFQPVFRLQESAVIWMVGYFLLLLMVGTCAFLVWRSTPSVVMLPGSATVAEPAPVEPPPAMEEPVTAVTATKPAPMRENERVIRKPGRRFRARQVAPTVAPALRAPVAREKASNLVFFISLLPLALGSLLAGMVLIAMAKMLLRPDMITFLSAETVFNLRTGAMSLGVIATVGCLAFLTIPWIAKLSDGGITVARLPWIPIGVICAVLAVVLVALSQLVFTPETITSLHSSDVAFLQNGALGFGVLYAVLALAFLLSPLAQNMAGSTAASTSEITIPMRIRWVALAAAPSSLMLGVTTYMTTDIAAIPLFWIVPLSLYLLSFILVFARWPWVWTGTPHLVCVYLQPVAMLSLGVVVFASWGVSTFAMIVAHLTAFFACVMVCHGELAKDRPAAKHLTEFFLWMSVGGVVGGLFNSFFAPLVFKLLIEYILVLVAVLFLRPQTHFWAVGDWRRALVVAGMLVAQMIVVRLIFAFWPFGAIDGGLQMLIYALNIPLVLMTLMWFTPSFDAQKNLVTQGLVFLGAMALIGYFLRIDSPADTANAVLPLWKRLDWGSIFAMGAAIAMSLVIWSAIWVALGNQKALADWFYKWKSAPRDDHSIQEYLLDLGYAGCLALLAFALLRLSLSQTLWKPSADFTRWLAEIYHGNTFRFSPQTAWRWARWTELALIEGIPIAICLAFSGRTVRLGLGVVALFAVNYTMLYPGESDIVYRNRSFFSVQSVRREESNKGIYHVLIHGGIDHGRQLVDPEKANLNLKLYFRPDNPRDQPISYFYPDNPIGQVFMQMRELTSRPPYAVVGLGVGTLVTYAEGVTEEEKKSGKKGQTAHIYEIDPAVLKLSGLRVDEKDNFYKLEEVPTFYYLQDSITRGVDFAVKIGDGRLKLKDAPPNFYQIIVLDAFSSDAIPVHLLTKEAIEMYLTKLREDGILIFNITNRYVRMAPVLADACRELDLICLHQTNDEDPDYPDKSGTEWVIMFRKKDKKKQACDAAAIVAMPAAALMGNLPVTSLLAAPLSDVQIKKEGQSAAKPLEVDSPWLGLLAAGSAPKPTTDDQKKLQQDPVPTLTYADGLPLQLWLSAFVPPRIEFHPERPRELGTWLWDEPKPTGRPAWTDDFQDLIRAMNWFR